jgi:hypothetical protein
MVSIGELATRANRPAAAPASTVHQQARIPELNALLLHDLRVLRPYVGLRPPRMLTLSTDDELRVSGTQWVSTGIGWRRVPDPMPRVRFVPEWKVVDNPGTLSGIDIRHTALVTEDLRAAPAVDATASLIVDEPGHIVVDVSTPRPALLVTTEAYDSGWRATAASGAMLHSLPVYGDYLGVMVEPGDYRISLGFQPDSIRVGLYTSLSGLIVIAIVAAFTSWKRLSHRE